MRLQVACGAGAGEEESDSFAGVRTWGLRDVFGGIRVVIPKAETRGPEEIRNPNAEWSVITPDGNSLALLKDTWASAGPGIVRHMEWASDPFSLSLTDRPGHYEGFVRG